MLMSSSVLFVPLLSLLWFWKWGKWLLLLSFRWCWSFSLIRYLSVEIKIFKTEGKEVQTAGIFNTFRLWSSFLFEIVRLTVLNSILTRNFSTYIFIFIYLFNADKFNLTIKFNLSSYFATRHVWKFIFFAIFWSKFAFIFASLDFARNNLLKFSLKKFVCITFVIFFHGTACEAWWFIQWYQRHR